MRTPEEMYEAHGPLTAVEVRELRTEVDALAKLADDAWAVVASARMAAELAATKHRVARELAVARMQGRRT